MANAITSGMSDLIKDFENAMEEAWIDHANGITPSSLVYDIADELVNLGIGAVYIPNMQGKLKWFDLENMEF